MLASDWYRLIYRYRIGSGNIVLGQHLEKHTCIFAGAFWAHVSLLFKPQWVQNGGRNRGGGGRMSRGGRGGGGRAARHLLMCSPLNSHCAHPVHCLWLFSLLLLFLSDGSSRSHFAPHTQTHQWYHCRHPDTTDKADCHLVELCWLKWDFNLWLYLFWIPILAPD